MASAGKEVIEDHEAWMALIQKTAAKHAARKGCEFPEGFESEILGAIVDAFERVEICRAEAA